MRSSDPLAGILAPWQRYDALWYEHIARSGYDVPDATQFFPLFPMLSRGASWLLGGNVVLAGLVVSSIAFVVAMWLLQKLVRRETDSVAALGIESPSTTQGHIRASRLVVLLIALFPTGFFLLAPYTESLFLALTVAAIWFARTGRPWGAGIAGFLASLARAQGVFLVLPLAYEYARQRGLFRWLSRRGGNPPGPDVLGSVLPLAGFLLWAQYQRDVIGVQAFDAVKGWGYQIVPPWDALNASWMLIRSGGNNSIRGDIEAFNLVCLLVFAALAIVGARRLPLSYSLYAWPSLALLFARETAVSPLAGASRYVLVIFPCFIVMAGWLLRRPMLAAGWLLVSAALLLIMFTFWVRWGFVA
jgi:hypothetical protein